MIGVGSQNNTMGSAQLTLLSNDISARFKYRTCPTPVPTRTIIRGYVIHSSKILSPSRLSSVLNPLVDKTVKPPIPVNISQSVTGPNTIQSSRILHRPEHSTWKLTK